MKRLSLGALVWAALLSAGCAGEKYRYVPAEHRVEQSNAYDRKTEALYSVPEDKPSGKVRVVSMGVEDGKLQLRLGVTNQSETQTWIVNADEQFVSFPNRGQVKPVLSSGESVVEIKPKDLRTLDLYFPLPTETKSEKNLPEFDFHWKIKAGNQIVAETTPFDRAQIPDPPPLVYPYVGMGSSIWWTTW